MKAKTFNAALIILLLTFCAIVNATEQIFFDDFETSLGWVRNPFYTDDATTGMWERDNPEETVYDVTMQLGTTVSGEKGLCTGHLAGDYPGSYDIDYGKTTVRSPDITLPSDGQDITLSFSYYLAHYSNATSDDYLRVKVVGTTTQTVLEELGSADIDEGVWETFSTSLSDFAGQTIYILIEAADETYASLVEAGIDDVLIEKIATPGPQDGYWQMLAGGDDIYPTNYWERGVAIGVPNCPTGFKFFVEGKSTFNDIVGIGAVPDPSDIENLQVEGKIKVSGAGIDVTNQIWPGMVNISDGTNSVNITHEQIALTDGSRSFYMGPDGMNALRVVTEEVTSDEIKVNGELIAKQVTVTLDGFPDHVFNKDYKLKSLEEVEQYVNENKHLPGVPSEKEVRENGLSLGDMQAKLLEKIEELTLYLIDMKKENKALKEEIKELKKQ